MNNPPAFPHTVELRGVDQRGIIPHGGMTLRDYFAAKAMQAHVQREDIFTAISQDRLTPEQVCDGCYKWADLMLKAREK